MVSDEHRRRVLAHQEKQAASLEKPMVLFTAEVVVDLDMVQMQDGGSALIFEVDFNPGGEDGLFVRIQSWDSGPEEGHEDFRRLIGRKIEVIIRTID